MRDVFAGSLSEDVDSSRVIMRVIAHAEQAPTYKDLPDAPGLWIRFSPNFDTPGFEECVITHEGVCVVRGDKFYPVTEGGWNDSRWYGPIPKEEVKG